MDTSPSLSPPLFASLPLPLMLTFRRHTHCVSAAGQKRFIKERTVFACTAFFSVFACACNLTRSSRMQSHPHLPHAISPASPACSYAWLYYILIVVTPNIVDVWEGLATFLLFPLLVLLAYMAGNGQKPVALRLGTVSPPDRASS